MDELHLIEKSDSEHSTVFILGAGLSYMYGFPSGAELLDRIISKISVLINPDNEVFFRKMLQQMKASQVRSIDHFIELHPQYSDVIKPLIMEKIYEKENEANLWSGNGTFYRDLFQMVFVDYPETEFSVINFNYDRSLIHSLVTQLVARNLAKTSEDAYAKLSARIAIYTPFGTLGSLEYSKSTNNDILPFGEYVHNQHKSRMMAQQQINLYFEEALHKDKVQKVVKTADTLFFLGMAYHNQNMDALGVWKQELTSNPQRRIGTHYMLEPRDFDRINHKGWEIEFFTGLDTTEKLFAHGFSALGRKFEAYRSSFPSIRY